MSEDEAVFIEPVAMEDDPAELFAGDTGTQDHRAWQRDRHSHPLHERAILLVRADQQRR